MNQWVEHLKAILLFRDLFNVIYRVLSDMQDLSDVDNKTSSKLYDLLSSVDKCPFIITVITAIMQDLP